MSSTTDPSSGWCGATSASCVCARSPTGSATDSRSSRCCTSSGRSCSFSWCSCSIGTLNDEALPTWLETTVDSARSVFSAMAGGLITSITLLLSMMLVAVQLASTPVLAANAPRLARQSNAATRDRPGARHHRVLSPRLAVDEGLRRGGHDAIVPHVTVLVAVALGVLSLVAVVRSVDHLTQSRARRLRRRSGRRRDDRSRRSGRRAPSPAGRRPTVVLGSGTDELPTTSTIPPDAVAIEAPTAGWIQQVDTEALLDASPEASTAVVAVSIGEFRSRACAAGVDLDRSPDADDPCRTRSSPSVRDRRRANHAARRRVRPRAAHRHRRAGALAGSERSDDGMRRDRAHRRRAAVDLGARATVDNPNSRDGRPSCCWSRLTRPTSIDRWGRSVATAPPIPR